MYQNKLMDGVQGNAGYIGHTVLNAEGPMCVCGNRGCLDAYAGELALNRRYQELTNSENESYYTMRDFMKLSRNGDAVSQKILKDAAFYPAHFLDGTDFLFFSETSGTVCKDEHLGRKNDRESGGTGI